MLAARLQNDPPTVMVAGGPRHMTFDASETHAYVLSETANTITSFAYDAATGRLSAPEVIDSFQTRKGSSAHIVAHPGGHLLFASNRGENSRPQDRRAAEASGRTRRRPAHVRRRRAATVSTPKVELSTRGTPRAHARRWALDRLPAARVQRARALRGRSHLGARRGRDAQGQLVLKPSSMSSIQMVTRSGRLWLQVGPRGSSSQYIVIS